MTILVGVLARAFLTRAGTLVMLPGTLMGVKTWAEPLVSLERRKAIGAVVRADSGTCA